MLNNNLDLFDLLSNNIKSVFVSKDKIFILLKFIEDNHLLFKFSSFGELQQTGYCGSCMDIDFWIVNNKGIRKSKSKL